MINLLNKSKVTSRALSHKSNHYCKRFSTFQHLDANKRRDCIVFEDIYADLVTEHLPDLSDSHKQLIIVKKVYAIDSITIALFQPIFECVGHNPNNGKRKRGIKSHQKLDMQAGILGKYTIVMQVSTTLYLYKKKVQ
jgi:hypothetical protein